MLIELTIGLPETHFSPASITVHFELSIITGTRAMSGSAAISLRKVVIATLGVEQALVHVDVDDLRAVLDLLARDLDRGGIIAGHDQLLERRRAGDVGALADIDETGGGAASSVSVIPAKAEAVDGIDRGCEPRPSPGDGAQAAMVIGSSPARRVRPSASASRAAAALRPPRRSPRYAPASCRSSRRRC